MPEDDDLSKQIQGRFNPGSSGGTTEDTSESTGSTDSTSSDETTRSMAQYSMYLPGIRTQELKTLYQRINLQRLENDEPEIEKNRHFNRAIVEVALAHEDEIRERVDELTE